MKSAKTIKKYLTVFVLLCFFSSTYAQWIKTSLPDIDYSIRINQIFKYKAALFAACNNGLFSSKDNGLTWNRKSIRWDITKIWVDGSTLYAAIDGKYYISSYNSSGDKLYIDEKERCCLLKSTDDGETWQSIKLIPKGSILNLDFSDATISNNKTYIWGHFLLGGNGSYVDSSGLLNRACQDTCSWKNIYPENNYSTTNFISRAKFISFKNRVFIQFYLNSGYSLARLDNDTVKFIIANPVENSYFFEKNDTLFLTYKNQAAEIKNIISVDWGQTWLPTPNQYKIPSYDKSVTISKIGNTYYAYDNNFSKELSSKDIIKWDTLDLFKNNLGPVIYNDSVKTIFRHGLNIFTRSDDNGLNYYSNHSGFTSYLGNISNTFGIAADSSILCSTLIFTDQWASRRTTNGGVTWQAGRNQDLWRNSCKIKNKYYSFTEKVIYELKDYNQSKWDSIGTFPENEYYNQYSVLKDTLYRVHKGTPDLLEFSIDIGKTWSTFYRFSNDFLYTIDSYIFQDDRKYIFSYDKIVNSNDNTTWIVTPKPIGSSLSIQSSDFYFISNSRVANRYIDKLHVEKRYNLGKVNKRLTTDITTRPKELSSYLVDKNKIWIVIQNIKSLPPSPSINNVEEVFQSDSSGNNWIKVFEVPNYNSIRQMFSLKDTLYIAVGDKGIYTDTTASLYKAAFSDLTKQNTIGRVYWDKNKNSLFDADDIWLSDVNITRKDLFTKTDSGGKYAFYLPSKGDTLKPIPPKKFMTSVPPYYLTTLNDTAKNFAIQAPAYQDLAITLTTPSVFRPGFETSVVLTVENRGLKAQNALVSLVLDNKTTFLSALPTASKIGDTLKWDLGLLAIDEVKNIQLKFKTPVTALLDSVIRLNGAVLPIEQDSSKEDNFSLLSSKVVGSYDPNDKLVEPKTYTPDNVAKGLPLNYTIRFQNTGNYPASFVVVEDTLGDYFDLGTFRFISSSHPCTYEYKGKGIIRFIFSDINLPDSISNEASSHGFVKYSIVPKTSLKKGDFILNTAHIYFDYNKPVITPTSKLGITTPTSIWQVPKVTEHISIYPNPAENIITIDIDDDRFKVGFLSIYDLSGRLMFTKSISDKSAVIDVSHLSVGEYICSIKSLDNKIFVNKFVKVQ